MPAPRILAFAGSARRESFNRKFLSIAVGEARAGGAEVTAVNLGEDPFPLYEGDLEDKQGIPDPVLKLVTLIQGHQALLIASPEYNSLITPLLKNTLDWCSRAEPNPFIGKVAAVITASPGAFGGVKSGLAARQVLSRLGCLVIATECTLPRAHEAFDETGGLKNDHAFKTVHSVVAELIRTTLKLNA